MSGQMPLFPGAGQSEEASRAEVLPQITEEDREVAARLPSWVHLGTSSWSFPGWSGLLWKGRPTEDDLARAGLRAYAQQPLLRTVCVDRSYYGPLRAEDVASYATQLDEAAALTPDLPRFRLVSKVWDEITTAVFPTHPRYGARAGQANPAFLDASRFLGEVLEPYRGFGRHFGPFVFELTPMPRGAMDDRALADRVDAFLSALPDTWPDGTTHAWAFELRNQELMTDRWHSVLRAHRAAHVFTYWTAMPSLRAQLASHGKIASPFVVARLMLPPFMRYAEKKAEYAPFDRLVAPQSDMRDDVLNILRAAQEADCTDAFIIANNKAEGSAPLTARELAIRIAKELGA
jgi:uncharacterized protein YecE (DUF72 family)